MWLLGGCKNVNIRRKCFGIIEGASADEARWSVPPFGENEILAPDDGHALRTARDQLTVARWRLQFLLNHPARQKLYFVLLYENVDGVRAARLSLACATMASVNDERLIVDTIAGFPAIALTFVSV